MPAGAAAPPGDPARSPPGQLVAPSPGQAMHAARTESLTSVGSVPPQPPARSPQARPLPCTAQDLARFSDTHYYSAGASRLAASFPGGGLGVSAVDALLPESADTCGPDGAPGYRLRLVSGRSHRKLGEDVGKLLGVPLSDIKCSPELTGEIVVQSNKTNMRGDDVFVVQPMAANPEEGMDVNEALMELLNLVHFLRLEAARRVTAVIPYFAYSRQDRKTKPRVPISACATAQLLVAMGLDRVVTVDLHSGQIQGFFTNVPVDILPVTSEWANYISRRVCPREGIEPRQITVVAPDASGVDRATRTADRIQEGCKVVTILNRRVEQKTGAKEAERVSNVVHRMDLIGDVSGDVCVIVDDIVDTASTLLTAVRLLTEKNARAIYACVTHGLLNGCVEQLSTCPGLTQVAMLDTLPSAIRAAAATDKIHVISCAPLLAMAISRQHQEEPLSALSNPIAR